MQRSVTPWASTHAVKAFWTGFLNPDRETEIVLSDDAASVIEDITKEPISLDDYQSRSFIQNLKSSTISADQKAVLDQVFNHNLVAFGAASANGHNWARSRRKRAGRFSSAPGRFCCRSQLRAPASNDSVVVTLDSGFGGGSDDGAEQPGSGAAVLLF